MDDPTYIAVKYIGRKAIYTENLTGARYSFTKNVPIEIPPEHAKLLLKHSDVFASASDYEYVKATRNGDGENRKLVAGDFIIPADAWSVVSSRPLNPKGIRTDIVSTTSRILNVLSADVTSIRLVYFGYYNKTTGDGESPIPNPVFLKASIHPASAIGDEVAPALGFDAFFNGKSWAVLGRGQMLISDPIDISMLKGQPFYTKTWESADIPAAPTAPTLGQAATGGYLANATYKAALTIAYAEPGLESQASAGTSITLNGGTSTQSITVTAPTAVAGAIGYRVWMTDSSGNEPYYDAGCGVVGFGTSAKILAACPSGAATTAEFVLPSTPRAVPYGAGGARGGTGAGAANTGEGAINNADATGRSFGVAITPGSSALSGVGPAVVLGRTEGEQPSVAVVGDSIGDGSHDSGYGGVAGFMARGVQKQLGRRYDPTIAPDVGLVVVTQGSETPSRTADGRFNRRFQLAALASTVICDHATNSLTSGSAFVMYYVLATADRFLGLGKAYYHTTCTPRHSSTDGYVLLANHTQQFSVIEGARRQVNAWLRDETGQSLVRADIPFRATAATVGPSYDFYGGGDGVTDTFIPKYVFVQGSETVRVNGVKTAAYTMYNTQTIDGVSYAQGIRFTTPPAAGAVVTIDYTKIGGLRAMRKIAGIFDSAALVEVNAQGQLEKNGGWWPGDAGTVLPARTATATATNSIADSSLSLATDQYRGYTVTIIEDTTTPASVGQTRVIVANTLTSFSLITWTVTPSVGAKFVVNDCATGDGLHPSTRMHIEMAKAIDPSLF